MCSRSSIPRPDAVEHVARPHFPGRAPIDAYGAGGFRFADMSHRGSILCLPSGIYAWDVADASELTRAVLAPIFAEATDIDHLLIGTGADFAVIPRPLRDALRSASITGEPMATGAAARTYNILLGERRRVAAALIAVA